MDEIRIIGLPSPLDIGEAVKNMALRKIREETEFATLSFISSKTPDEVLTAGVKQLLESEGYKLSEEIMHRQLWVVQIHELKLRDDTTMHISGQVKLTDRMQMFAHLTLSLNCNLTKGLGTIYQHSISLQN